ncbi:cAMP-dependent protein kinase inhibitor beta isoform X1 [Phacochoerus africanus]|uniref:cAMP-dependent protein kinase inhibitor beta isoform X1 n=1 Tax=Phacochoerus africanus TaxID=41426 RepID=UPI001FDA6A30|nr:cAMP-dependent protein kinase inhibitor beta isoform X1 [Phacochoerus africanus]
MSTVQDSRAEETPSQLPGSAESETPAGEQRSTLGGGPLRPLSPPPVSPPPPGCAPAGQLRRGRILVDGRGGSELEPELQLAAAERPGEPERAGIRPRLGGQLCAWPGSWYTEKALNQEKSGRSWKPSSF